MTTDNEQMKSHIQQLLIQRDEAMRVAAEMKGVANSYRSVNRIMFFVFVFQMVMDLWARSYSL